MSGDAWLLLSSTEKHSRRDLRAVREGDLVLEDVGKRAVPVGTLERGGCKLQRGETGVRRNGQS